MPRESIKESGEDKVVKRTSVTVTPDGLFTEGFSDGSHCSAPVKTIVNGKQRVEVKFDNSNPEKPMYIEIYKDGSYRTFPVDSIKE